MQYTLKVCAQVIEHVFFSAAQAYVRVRWDGVFEMENMEAYGKRS